MNVFTEATQYDYAAQVEFLLVGTHSRPTTTDG